MGPLKIYICDQGPRNCVGKRYAMLTMKLAVVHLLRRHRLVSTENTEPELRQWRLVSGATVPFRAVPV